MLKYVVTIEGHRVVALIDQFGPELSRLYIDGEFCDIYDPNDFNPWKDDELWPGFFSPMWKTILRGPFVGADGEPVLIEFQIRSGGNAVYDRILCAGEIVKRWKNTHSIGFSGRQRSLDCQRRLPRYFPCAPSSQLRNLSENKLNNIGSLKIYH